MKCCECGSKKCTFDILFKGRDHYLFDKNGKVTFSDVEDIEEGSNIFSKLPLLAIEFNYNDVCIDGSCMNCQDECGMIVEFKDGHIADNSDDAFEYLINELNNNSPSITKISTEHLKSLIPQYVKEYFGDKALGALVDEKNWKRISKSKDNGKILRIFEYKKNSEIKLYISSNESDTEIVGHEFNGEKISSNFLSQITNGKTEVEVEAKNLNKKNGTYDHILIILKDINSSKTAKGKAMAQAVNIAKNSNKHLDGLKDMVRTCTLDYKVQFDKISDEKTKILIRERIKSKEDGVIEIIEKLNK